MKKYLKSSLSVTNLIAILRTIIYTTVGLIPREPKDEKAIIKDLYIPENYLVVGDRYYLVNMRWWDSWKNFCTI